MQHNCRVLHYVNPNPFKSSLIHERGDELLSFVSENKHDFTVVANPVMEFCEDAEDVLNKIYKLTNSIDTAWYDYRKSQPTKRVEKDGCRSTSVGDIIEIDNKQYIVDSFGFTYLKNNTKG